MSAHNGTKPEDTAPLVDDIDLSAYLDGEASAADRRRVAAALESDAPGLARRMDTLRGADAAVIRFADALYATAPPARLCIRRMAAERRAKRVRLVGVAAIAACLMFFSFAGGWIGHGVFHQQTFAARSFIEAATASHQVFVVETRHPVEVAGAEQRHLVTWLSKRLNHQISAPNLTAHGFTLVGGRLLATRTGAPAAQLMYEDSRGKRVTLYAARTAGAAESAFNFFASRYGKAESIYWFEREVGYALTGPFAKETLLKLAHDVLEAMDDAAS